MFDLAKWTKIAGAWGASILIVALAVWLWRGREKDNEWSLRIATARPDTTVHIDTLRLPAPKPTVGTADVVHLNSTIDAIYAEARLIAMERDSLRDCLRHLLEPKKITIRSDNIGELLVTLYPSHDPLKADSASWIHRPPPPIEIVRTETITKEVPVNNSNVLWYAAGCLVAGAGITYAIEHLK